MISIIIPYYPMKNAVPFLMRCLRSIEEQEYRDWEVIITQDGTSPATTNAGVIRAKGDIIKILHMDDFFSSKFSLTEIAEAFTDGVKWIATGCTHTRDGIERINPHYAEWNRDIKYGKNTIGAPSVIACRRSCYIPMDQNLVWVFDCDFYEKMYQKYGEPKLVKSLNVVIGLGSHQATNNITNSRKDAEIELLHARY